MGSRDSMEAQTRNIYPKQHQRKIRSTKIVTICPLPSLVWVYAVTRLEKRWQRGKRDNGLSAIASATSMSLRGPCCTLQRIASSLSRKLVLSPGSQYCIWFARKAILTLSNLLLRNGASLETRDFEKNTPLLSALDYGRVNVVSRLVRAGGNTTVTNRSGSSFIGKAREALSWQEEQRKYNQRIIDVKPQVSAKDLKEPKEIHKMYNSKGKCVLKYFVDDNPPYVPTDEERERATARLQRIDERLVCLGNIIQDYESNVRRRGGGEERKWNPSAPRPCSPHDPRDEAGAR